MIILSFNYDDLIIIKGPGRGEEVRQWLQEHKEVFVFLCDADVDVDVIMITMNTIMTRR